LKKLLLSGGSFIGKKRKNGQKLDLKTEAGIFSVVERS
jgi:hypothetical protein